MSAKHLARIAFLAAALLAADSRSGSAQSEFSGKTIRLYIGTGPGGGYDTYGRWVARHIGRHIPGNPALVPQNMPGASSLTLTNFLFNTASRDGTAIAIINQAMPTEQYLDLGNTNYDAKRFNWIGRVSSAVEMAIVWHTVPVSTIEDVRRRETLMGGTGPTSSTVFVPYLLNNLAGMKFKVVTGFNGTTEIALAMERGEVEGSATPLESLTSYRAEWVRDRKIRILVQYTATRDAEMSDVPTMVELGRSEEARQILGFYASAADIGRSIVAPPGLALQTVATLRRAFDEMLADPVFLEEGRRAGIPLKPMSGDRLQELVSRVGSFPPPLIEKARRAREKPN
ncbi:MAG TPA: tripartite tricarboxylate transporter substrate-binding protein [Xanthobacteraceae bacterium]